VAGLEATPPASSQEAEQRHIPPKLPKSDSSPVQQLFLRLGTPGRGRSGLGDAAKFLLDLGRNRPYTLKG
jgi:hypothetical protein